MDKQKTYNIDNSLFKDAIENGLLSGFAIHEMLYDENGKAVDYKYVFVNDEFYKLTGIKEDVIGKTVKQLMPDTDEYWINQYEKVVKEGKVLKFAHFSTPLQKHYDVVAKKMGENLFAVDFKDVTEVIETNEEISDHKDRLNAMLQSIGDGIIATDKDSNVILINKAAKKIIGCEDEYLIGRYFYDVIPLLFKYDQKKIYTIKKGFLNREFNSVKYTIDDHLVMTSRKGEEVIITATISAVRNHDDEYTGAIIVFKDASKERKTRDDIEYINTHDHLTGVYNRYYFEKKLKEAYECKHYPISVIMGDVNGLKLINDAFGHKEGDKLLISVVEILDKATRGNDIIARWGGDEFVILLPNTDRKEVYKVVSRINMLCKNDQRQLIKSSISVGHSTLENEEDNKDVLKEAEDSMYRIKLQHGRSFRSALIATLENTLIEKSQETEAHAKNMTSLAERFGRELGLDEDSLDKLTLLARLHDVGKIGITDSVLKKHGRLDDEDWQQIRLHPEIGYRIVNGITELRHIADGILHHHERWDGTGYPNGVKGDEIPYISRIISIIDAYEVMTNGRSYKKAINHEDAIAEIIRCAGRQFDPRLVEIFVQVCNGEYVKTKKRVAL